MYTERCTFVHTDKILPININKHCDSSNDAVWFFVIRNTITCPKRIRYVVFSAGLSIHKTKYPVCFSKKFYVLIEE